MMYGVRSGLSVGRQGTEKKKTRKANGARYPVYTIPGEIAIRYAHRTVTRGPIDFAEAHRRRRCTATAIVNAIGIDMRVAKSKEVAAICIAGTSPSLCFLIVIISK